jgi:hypothetical protein
MISISMGRTKIIETEEQRQLRFKRYQDKYYSNPVNQQTVYAANQRTQAERFRRWYTNKHSSEQQGSMIIQTPSEVYFQCNNKIFYNVYLAQYESMTSGKPVELYCHDREYDQLDWTQEPEQTFDDIMSAHAINLRNKYERLVFMWSGGTDSHTIYNIFKRNNIHIDEFIVKHTNQIEGGDPYPDSHVDWLMKNHWDPTSKITTWGEYDLGLRSQVVSNEDWIFQNKGDLLRLGQSSVSNLTVEHCERNHNGHRWGLVVGLEKPSVVFRNGRYYASQVDKFLRTAMGHPNVECFYLDPMVNLKQSHLAKKTLKLLQSRNHTSERGIYTENRDNAQGYNAWAKAVGRHPELTFGSSWVQKKLLSPMWDAKITPGTDIDDYDPKGEPMLIAQLKAGNAVARNYVKGLYSIRSDEKFFNFLNANALKEQNTLLKLKEIYSKQYDLGE